QRGWMTGAAGSAG
ncbi:hypothetical protein CLOP_g18998, partial [Closterium sp. NIES-67]